MPRANVVTAEWLLQGGVAIVPTDTVYGLAAQPSEGPLSVRSTA